MKAEHSPIPWKTQKGESNFNDENRCRSISAGNHLICEIWDDEPQFGTGRANAEFIVRAVNCHNELVAALGRARDILEVHAKVSAPLLGHPPLNAQETAIADAYFTLKNAVEKARVKPW